MQRRAYAVQSGSRAFIENLRMARYSVYPGLYKGVPESAA
jgi:hypothetical protein